MDWPYAAEMPQFFFEPAKMPFVLAVADTSTSLPAPGRKSDHVYDGAPRTGPRGPYTRCSGVEASRDA